MKGNEVIASLWTKPLPSVGVADEIKFVQFETVLTATAHKCSSAHFLTRRALHVTSYDLAPETNSAAIVYVLKPAVVSVHSAVWVFEVAGGASENLVSRKAYGTQHTDGWASGVRQ